ncbi:MAG: immunoglobulin domain-containing protein [Cellulomonas sp.]|uniref:immunoglobulin domain-containing protein n=1 Tax=Cellulomonas sp. TaxID=40001 RepID=UPI0019ED5249|nr:immunoglobulin domain-containing protein [Cellulomonas sp.]MBF0688457.1 immunoglobulin domain-containing protein [Cellulomonas sp.]
MLATGLVAAPAQAAATVIAVTTATDAPLTAGCSSSVAGTSLREALCQAGDTAEAVVELPAGTYDLTAGALTVDPGDALDLTLRGADRATTVIDGGGTARVLDVDPALVGGVDLTVERVTLRNGVGTPETGGGGAIIAGSGDPDAPDSLTLRDCAITGNRNTPGGGLPSDVGGAVSMAGGSLRVERCTLTGNTAIGAGGGAIGFTGVDGTDEVVVVDSVVSGNAVEASGVQSTVGGALDVAWGDPTTTITGTRFEDNTLRTGSRPATGSAVRVATGTATLTGLAVTGNEAVGGTGSTAALDLAGGTLSDSRVVLNVTDVDDVRTRAGVAGADSAVRTWWGCNDLGTTCDSAGGATTAPHATATLSLSDGTVNAGQLVSANLDLTMSDGSRPTSAFFSAVAGAPVTWAGATFRSTVDSLGSAASAGASWSAESTTTVTASLDGMTASGLMTVLVPPVVTTQPSDAAAPEGGSATFVAAATGDPAPTVTWQRRADASADWATVAGATSGTLVLPGLTLADHGAQVRAVFTSTAGTATTSPATLSVGYGPQDVVGPADVTGLAGSDVTFTASASGRPTPTVQWQTSTDGTTWTDVADATSWTYTRTLAADDDGLLVRAVATGATGDVPTSPASVTLESAPVVTTQPADATVAIGDDAVFTVAGSGAPAPTVSWWQQTPSGWERLAETGTTLTLPARDLSHHGQEVRAVLTNVHGSTDSRVAQVLVPHAPTITAHPADVEGRLGEIVEFHVGVTGYPAPNVEWQVSWDGSYWLTTKWGTSTVYGGALGTGERGMRVRAVVSGGGVTLISESAYVTVLADPTVTAPASTTVTLGEDATFTVEAGGTPTPTVTWQRRGAGEASWTDAGTGTSLVLADVTPADDGTQVRAVVTNKLGSVTSATATLTVRWAPTFTRQPAAATVYTGQVATFSAAGNGNPTPVVQWQTSTDGTTWSDVPGATSWTYARTTTTADDGLRVRVVATGWAGPVASSVAVLTVEHGPAITAQPQDVSVGAGGDAGFEVGVTGTPAPIVQWVTRAPGGGWTVAGSGRSFLLEGVTAADNGTQVAAVVGNTHGSVTSTVATLEVLYRATFTQQPADVTGLADDTVTFTAAVDANPAPTLTWETSTDGSSWSAVAGATATTYTRTLTDADDGLQVRVVAVSSMGRTVSDVAHVTVEAAPVVTAQPADATVDLGTSATFEVQVTGRPAPDVTWQTEVDGDWVVVPGATGTTLVVPGTDAAHGTRYRAVATNARGTATSDPATMRVLLAPTVSDPEDVATAPGEEVTFTVDVTGRPLPDVTWEVSSDGAMWTTVGTGTALRLTPTLSDDGLLVRAVASATLTSGPVSATSAAAELAVADAPVVIDGPGALTTLTAGVPTTLAWTILAADASAAWHVSRDGGATWAPVPVGWVVDAQAARAMARAAGPAVRTVHSLALTPAIADEGALVRLTVTTAGGTASPSTVLDVAGVPDPGTGAGGPGAGAPGAGGSAGSGDAPGGAAGTGSSSTARPAGGAALSSTGAEPLRLLALGALLASAGVVALVAATRRRGARA